MAAACPWFAVYRREIHADRDFPPQNRRFPLVFPPNTLNFACKNTKKY